MGLINYAKRVGNILVKDLSLWQNGREIIDTYSDYWNLTAGIKDTTSWVESCANTMGNFYGVAKRRLYKQKTDGTLKEIFDHPYLDIERYPNEFQVGFETKYFTALFQVYHGNAYFLKLYDGMGTWRQIIPLDPSLIKPVSSKSRYIDHYEYTVNGDTIKYEPEKIIHKRYPHAGSFIKGAPLISNIMDQIEIDKFQTALQKQFYGNGGFMGQTWSTTQQLSKVSFNNAKAQLEQRVGSGNFKFGLFDGGLTPVKAAYSIKDMDIAGQRKLTREEILAAFRMPQIMVGGSPDSYNRATVEAAVYVYASTFIDPILTFDDQVETRHVQREYNKQLIVKHDKLSPKDIENALKYYESGIRSGFLTRNEVRVEEDYEPSDGKYMDKFTDSVGGALVDLETGEQLGQVPNNVNPSNDKTSDEN